MAGMKTLFAVVLFSSAIAFAADKAIDPNPALTLRTPAKLEASFSTLKLFAFTVDFSSDRARTAFQSWDEKASPHWTGFFVVVDTDEKGSTVSRSDGKKGTCAITLEKLMAGIGEAKTKKDTRASALSSAVTGTLFQPCVNAENLAQGP